MRFLYLLPLVAAQHCQVLQQGALFLDTNFQLSKYPVELESKDALTGIVHTHAFVDCHDARAVGFQGSQLLWRTAPFDNTSFLHVTNAWHSGKDAYRAVGTQSYITSPAGTLDVSMLTLSESQPPQRSWTRHTSPNCTFEKDLCAWTQVKTDDFDLTRHIGATDSSGTGPSASHGGSYHIYAEASNPRKLGDKACIISPRIADSFAYAFKFHYHMYGKNIGTLEVKYNNNIVWTRSGSQQASAHEAFKAATVVLPGTAGEVTVCATVGNGWAADIAMDSFEFSTVRGPTVQPTGSPTVQPTPAPTVQPTPAPTVQPTPAPTVQPTGSPTANPVNKIAVAQGETDPSAQPTFHSTPSKQPTAPPTYYPTATAEHCDGACSFEHSLAVCCYSNLHHSDHLNWAREPYNSSLKHRFGNSYLSLRRGGVVGSRGDLQTDTLQASINEVEFWINMSADSAFEVKGRSEEGWHRLYYVDVETSWTWIRIESSTPILQLRFVGELSTEAAFVTLDDVETFSNHDTDMSWEITCFTILGTAIAVLFFLECTHNSFSVCDSLCKRRGARRRKMHGTALGMVDAEVPVGLELITIDGRLEEGKVAEEPNSIAF
jgi:hypothetical protein